MQKSAEIRRNQSLEKNLLPYIVSIIPLTNSCSEPSTRNEALVIGLPLFKLLPKRSRDCIPNWCKCPMNFQVKNIIRNGNSVMLWRCAGTALFHQADFQQFWYHSLCAPTKKLLICCRECKYPHFRYINDGRP